MCDFSLILSIIATILSATSIILAIRVNIKIKKTKNTIKVKGTANKVNNLNK